jgi:pyruvate,water dikinase
MVEFGMPFDVDVFIERPMFLTVNGYAYCRGSYRFTWRLLWVIPRISLAYARILPRLWRNLISDWRDKRLPAYLETVEPWKSVDLATASDKLLLSGIRELTLADATYWFQVALVLGAAKVTDGLLNRFLAFRFVRGELTSGIFLRGFPSQTIKAQVAPEAIARRIQAVESLREVVLTTPAGELLAALQQMPGAGSTTDDIHRHLQLYGHQIYTLDFVHPTQIEDPLPVLLSLKGLVKNDEYDTLARQAEMV